VADRAHDVVGQITKISPGLVPALVRQHSHGRRGGALADPEDGPDDIGTPWCSRGWEMKVARNPQTALLIGSIPRRVY
jgi:hypothetical protein